MTETKKYIGLHNGEKKGKNLQAVAQPNKKVEARLAARLKAWQADVGKMVTHGHQKPGSQQKARTA